MFPLTSNPPPRPFFLFHHKRTLSRTACEMIPVFFLRYLLFFFNCYFLFYVLNTWRKQLPIRYITFITSASRLPKISPTKCKLFSSPRGRRLVTLQQKYSWILGKLKKSDVVFPLCFYYHIYFIRRKRQLSNADFFGCREVPGFCYELYVIVTIYSLWWGSTTLT